MVWEDVLQCGRVFDSICVMKDALQRGRVWCSCGVGGCSAVWESVRVVWNLQWASDNGWHDWADQSLVPLCFLVSIPSLANFSLCLNNMLHQMQP